MDFLQRLKSIQIQTFCSDGSNYVRSSMFDCSKHKRGCSSLITQKWTRSSSFNVRKNDVRVCSISNLVNLVKALLDSKFDVRSFEAKNREFDHQQMNTYEFVWCLKNYVQVRSMFDKIVFDTSLIFCVSKVILIFEIAIWGTTTFPTLYIFQNECNDGSKLFNL